MTDTNIVKSEPAKRLTMHRLVGKIENVTARTPIARIAYHVNAITQAENPDGGTFPNFGGEFVGTDLRTGNIVTSGQATLPTALSHEVEGAKGDAAPNVTGVSVIGVEPKDGGGIAYYVEHEIPPARRSVIDMLHDHHASHVIREQARVLAEAEKTAAEAKKTK